MASETVTDGNKNISVGSDEVRCTESLTQSVKSDKEVSRS